MLSEHWNLEIYMRKKGVLKRYCFEIRRSKSRILSISACYGENLKTGIIRDWKLCFSLKMAVSLVYFKPAGKILDPKEGSELLRNDSGRDSQIAHYLRVF